jgi:hypothetical protein
MYDMCSSFIEDEAISSVVHAVYTRTNSIGRLPRGKDLFGSKVSTQETA